MCCLLELTEPLRRALSPFPASLSDNIMSEKSIKARPHPTTLTYRGCTTMLSLPGLALEILSSSQLYEDLVRPFCLAESDKECGG